jgi:formylglycine-generating enzyme required for sulfatase activity
VDYGWTVYSIMELVFKNGKEYFLIGINNKVVTYSDKNIIKVLKEPIQFLPKDERLQHKIKMSRNRIPEFWLDILDVTDEEYAEFQNAKDDNELKALCIRDAISKGCVLI